MRLKKPIAIFVLLALLSAAFNFACLQKGKAFALTAWDFTFLWLLLLPLKQIKTRKVIASICFIGLAMGLISTGIRGYLWFCYGTTPDTTFTIEALANTTINESLEFVVHDFGFICTWSLLTICVIAISSYLLWKFCEADTVENPKVLTNLLLFCSLIIISIGWFGTPMRRNFPPFTLASTISEINNYKQDWINQKKRSKEEISEAASAIVKSSLDNRTIVLVIGESTCRDNLSIYGYRRSTTPHLEQQVKSGDLKVIPHSWSIAAGTLAAFRSMFNLPVSIDGKKKVLQLFAIFKAAGWKIFWLSNQDDHAIESEYVSYADRKVELSRVDGRSARSLDEKVLPDFNKIISSMEPGNRLIVVHLIGLHPHFRVRYPEGFEVPWSRDDSISQELEAADRSESTQSKRNEYDTAVNYQDIVLDDLLRITKEHAKDKPTFWLYLSDHSVETGDCFDKTGHKVDSITSYKIPLIFWGNQAFYSEKETPKIVDGFRSDWLGETLLEAAGIKLKGIAEEKSIFSSKYRFAMPENVNRLMSSGCPNPLHPGKR